MLHLVTGVPGASKTAYVVTELDKIERQNKIYLKKNKLIYQYNQKLFEKYQDDFSYYEYEVGSGHELKIVLEHLPDDYFSFLNDDFDDLRPDYYFQRSNQYNEIIERIINRDGHQDFQLFYPVRTIYSNIKALKIDYVRANIYDWRECPDGSIIVIDEVQLVEPYSKLKDKDPIVQDLTIHRHRGFDFYFITQSPSLLHPTVKELIGVHYHITRPYGRTPKIYQFGSTRQYPNTLVNKINCEAKFSFKPNPRIFKLYKSTTIDTHKARFPKGLIGFGIFVLAALSLFIYAIMSPNKSSLVGGAKQHNVTPDQQVVQTNEAPKQPTQQDREAAFQAELERIRYNVNKPYELPDLSNHYTINDTPRLSGCISFDKTCTCYTQQATKIDMSQADCKRYMSGDKPFNPFFVKNNETNNSRINNNETF